MKVVIVGADEAGNSYVESSRELTGEPPLFVWDEPDLGNLADVIAGVDPAMASDEIEPAPGAFKWVLQVRPPHSQLKSPPRYGMHVTRTIDFDFVVSGRQECILDREVVELDAGDFIILKAANHAWRNSSDAPSAMLYMLYTPPAG